MLKYKYVRHKPHSNIILHTEVLTRASSIKNIILTSFVSKRIALNISRGPSIVAERVLSNIHQLKTKTAISVDWILNVNSENSWKKIDFSKDLLIIGPNVEFNKFYIREKTANFANVRILVPSPWVIPVLKEQISWFTGEFIVWQSDIDFNFWKAPSKKDKKKIMIYRKYDESDADFNLVMQLCQDLGINFQIITYGKYSRRQFKRALSESFAAVWLGTTESQGIALLECWAMDVPTFVREKNEFLDLSNGKRFPSSSAPYLNSECGKFFKSEEITRELLSRFLAEAKFLSPRGYVLNNFSKKESLNRLNILLT